MAPNMWSTMQEYAKRHDAGGGGHWLRLANDGDKAVVVFLGEPLPREVCFVDGKYMPYDAALKAAGHKPSLRVAINVALHPGREVKVLEQGIVFFKDLLRVRDKYGLDRWAFEVQRHGAPGDPKTHYSILPDAQLSADEQREYAALPLHDLGRMYGDAGKPTVALASSLEGTTAPARAAEAVDDKTAHAMGVVLRSLPREATERFCKKFGVARIRDLPAARVEKAVAFLDALEAEHKGRAPEGEADPFA